MSSADRRQDIGFVFPGQGAQSVGMMSGFATDCPEVAQRYTDASAVLGFDLWSLCAEGPESALNQTQNTQPALLAASVATWDVWLNAGGPLPALLAGHSFGEYSALVCAGALEFTDAVALVADRGRFMQEAVPEGEGAMAAVLGLELDALAAVCASVAETGVCAPANLNAPGQVVIAGTAAAVEAACALAAERGAKRAIRLPVSVPAHCELMRPASVRLTERLAGVSVEAPQLKVLHNVDVASHEKPAHILEALIAQLHSPVRWVETIEAFAAAGVTRIYECGPGKVLSGLVKRIDRSIECVPLTDAAAIRDAVAALHAQETRE